MGQGGSSFIFILVYWVWLGVRVRELFSPGKYCDVGFWLMSLLMREVLFEKKLRLGKILEGMGFEPTSLGIRSAVTDC
jgi:hypothetical protein